MKLGQVAAQLYTVREHTKTPRDLAATLRKIRSIGYPAVQVSAIGPIDNKELAAILDGEGLVCCATHESSSDILNQPRAVIDKLHKIRCRYTAYPYPADIDLTDAAAISNLAANLQQIGKTLAAAGIVLAYHNHQLEFRKINGQPILQKILDETSASCLVSELDTYWVQLGGGEPTEWCRRLKGRLPLIHLKDLMVNAENNPAITHLGNGNLNWPAIVAAAEAAGCEWFIVEQDDNWVNNDPFEALAKSLAYLREHVCTAN
jgi:sugar phosphate isomerase/epimerase